MKESSSPLLPHRNYVNGNVKESELHRAQDYNVDWDDPFGSDFAVHWRHYEGKLIIDSNSIKMRTMITNPEWI